MRFRRRPSPSLVLLALLALVALADSLYEDQIGKFDWKQTFVGKTKFVRFDASSTIKRAIVVTEENVIAALNVNNGRILWRQVLESKPRGDVQMLHVGEEVVTVSGSNPTIIRGWDTNAGYLLWEWSMRFNDVIPSNHWWIEDGFLNHLVPVIGSHLELTTYDMKTGQNKGTTSKIPASWISRKCVVSSSYITCISGTDAEPQQVFSLDVSSNAMQVFSKPISTFLSETGADIELKSLSEEFPGFVINNNIVLLKPSGFHHVNITLKDHTTSFYVMRIKETPILLESHYSDEKLHVLAANLINGNYVTKYSSSVSLPGANNPKIESAMYLQAKNTFDCRLFVMGEDSALYLVQNPGKRLWTREESLSRIVGVEMLDLPISELEAEIETEFGSKETVIGDPGNIWEMFVRRIKSQIAQLKTLINSLMPHLTNTHKGFNEKNSLIRDEFGLHKIIIVVTEVGKVFAIDNLSGNIIWRRYIPFLSSFSSRSSELGSVILYVQRTTRHLPYDAQCTIVARHKYTGHGMLFMFNPITGAAVDLGVTNLDYRIKQTTLLHSMNNEYLKGIVIMDENEAIHVYPPTCSQQINNTYMFVAESLSAIVRGYALKTENKQVVATKTWVVRLSTNHAHQITNVATKNPLERVHSQGKVMADRSVLYKYINPNLVAFTTEGPDPVHKDVLTLYLIDVVSGAIIMVQSHRRAKGPVRIVHSENWLVYSYYSEKSRRPEMATLELYEGPIRSESAFSSLETGRWTPEIARQAYVLPAPAPPLALATTVTDRGITSKDILVSLNNGAIVELPWMLLDPRRPIIPVAPVNSEMREEGLLQYTPELPLMAEAVINYNQTVVNIKNIHTSPSGLESTCLVFAYGLDIFYTRVAPSKTFDLLKEDFDYTLIVLVLSGLLVSSYAAKRFASRKVLRQAWK